MAEISIDNQHDAVPCAVAAIVTHGERVLFGRRKSTTSGFEWQLPGGWIEPGESPVDAVRRELREETGLALLSPRLVAITSNLFSPRCHSISLYFEAECVDASSLREAEADKCLGWEWQSWDEVDDDLFLPLRLLKQTDYRPFLSDERGTYVSF